MSVEIKSCPFCGRIPKVLTYEKDSIMIHCDCGVSQGCFSTEEDAIKSWNKQYDKIFIDRAYSELEMHGVSKERAKNIANGIDVLTTRLGKELDGMYHDNNKLKMTIDKALNMLKDILFCGGSMPIGIDEVQEVIKVLEN